MEFVAAKYENGEGYEEIQDIVENVLVSGISEISQKNEGRLPCFSIYIHIYFLPHSSACFIMCCSSCG